MILRFYLLTLEDYEINFNYKQNMTETTEIIPQYFPSFMECLSIYNTVPATKENFSSSGITPSSPYCHKFKLLDEMASILRLG